MPPKQKKAKPKKGAELELDAEVAAARALEQQRAEEALRRRQEADAALLRAERSVEDKWLLQRHRLLSQRVWWRCEFNAPDEEVGATLAAGGPGSRITQRLQRMLSAFYCVEADAGPQRLCRITFGLAKRITAASRTAAEEGEDSAEEPDGPPPLPDTVTDVVAWLCLGISGLPLRTVTPDPNVVPVNINVARCTATVTVGTLTTNQHRLAVRKIRNTLREHGGSLAAAAAAAAAAGASVCPEDFEGWTIEGPVAYTLQCSVSCTRWAWEHLRGELAGAPSPPMPPQSLIDAAGITREWAVARATVRAVCVRVLQALRVAGVLPAGPQAQQPSPAELAGILTVPPPGSAAQSLGRRGSNITVMSAGQPGAGSATYQQRCEFVNGQRVAVRGRYPGRVVPFSEARTDMVLRVTPSPRTFARLERRPYDPSATTVRPGHDVYVAEVLRRERDTVVLCRDWCPVREWGDPAAPCIGGDHAEDQQWWDKWDGMSRTDTRWLGPREYELCPWRPAVVTAVPSATVPALRCRADRHFASEGMEWDQVRPVGPPPGKAGARAAAAAAPAEFDFPERPPPGASDRWDTGMSLQLRLQQGCFAVGAPVRLPPVVGDGREPAVGGWNDAVAERAGEDPALRPGEYGTVLEVSAAGETGETLLYKVRGPRGGVDWYSTGVLQIAPGSELCCPVNRRSGMATLAHIVEQVPVEVVAAALEGMTDDQLALVFQVLRKNPQVFAAMVCSVTNQELRAASRVSRSGQLRVVACELDLQMQNMEAGRLGGTDQPEQHAAAQATVDPREEALVGLLEDIAECSELRRRARGAVKALQQSPLVRRIGLPQDAVPATAMALEMLTDTEAAALFAPSTPDAPQPPALPSCGRRGRKNSTKCSEPTPTPQATAPLLVCVARTAAATHEVLHPERVEVFNSFAQGWRTICPALLPTGCDFLLVRTSSARLGFAEARSGMRVTMVPEQLASRQQTFTGTITEVDDQNGLIAVDWDDPARGGPPLGCAGSAERREWWNHPAAKTRGESPYSKNGLGRLPARVGLRLVDDAVLLLDREKQRWYQLATQGRTGSSLHALCDMCTDWASGVLSRLCRQQLRIGTTVTVIDSGHVYSTHTDLAERLGVAGSWCPGALAPPGAIAKVVGSVVCEVGAPDGGGVRYAVSLEPEDPDDALQRRVVLIGAAGLDPYCKSAATLASNIVQRYDADSDMLLTRDEFFSAAAAFRLPLTPAAEALAAAEGTPPREALWRALLTARAERLVAEAAEAAAAAAAAGEEPPPTTAPDAPLRVGIPEVTCSLVRDWSLVRSIRHALTLPGSKRGTPSPCGRYLLL
eukprot:TRINITY_DN404_c1_g1_i1.p1 TRINITY_DN404_c1_g1~~TRINITY_DN404_c1_g1_i1.p1  ORF type:complete len:1326 (+),score=350.30 TRINITY_DN404_c1_g1_i1:86-4063(+)